MEEFKSISITSTVKKKGIPDCREFMASMTPVGSNAVFILNETKRDIGRKRFTLGPDCIIKSEDKLYKILDVSYFASPAVPIIQAALIA